MEQKREKPEGYNIYQARLHSITDDLVFKDSFTSLQAAIDVIMECFGYEHSGPLCSRGSVRCLDPVRRDWIVPNAFNNARALLFNSEQTAAEEWKITFYNMGDEIMGSRCSPENFSENEVNMELLNKNAFYCVVSAREVGAARNRFLIERIKINQNLNLTVFDAKGQPAKPYVLEKDEDWALAYANAIASDRAETLRIQALQKQLEN